MIFEDHYFFSHSGVAKRSLRANPEKRVRLAADTRVTWAQQQKAKKRVKRDLKLQDSDPKWPAMWYLNRGEGLDMNVIPAWMDGITGKGAVVTILDDGLEKDHPDLLKNYDPLASYDVNNQDSDPSPRYDMIDSNRHGTRCAGEVAAQSNNSICALGIAHGAQVGGVRMLDGDVTDAVEARSLSLNPQHIHIYSASWGPDDDGKTVDGPGELASRAFVEGVTKGRGGRGSIFIWASGNGGRDHDNCNCDGYTNSIYSLSISSATENGNVPWYSEACSSTLASTYSSGAVNEKQVVTTDLRHSCTSSHTGTSASAPLAAGICALALEANPNLTWRDMQHIVVRTARPQHLKAPDWQVNGVGRNVSHSFGYGLMDAYGMVKLARQWTGVPEQHSCDISAPDQAKSIPAKSVVILTLQVNDCEGVEILEHVQAKLSIAAHRRGDLHIQLTSPMGTRVTLLAHRDHDNSRAGFTHWPFMSVHSWGERPFGKWQLEIRNDGRLMGRVTLHSWSLVIYGTKRFAPTSPSSNDVVSSSKNNRLKTGKKKPKKPKHKSGNQKSIQTKAPKVDILKKTKSKSFLDVDSTINNTISNVIKKQNNASTTTTDVSPYFYAVSNSKLNLDHSNIVKHYLKFVKNITITYPVMIPAKDSPPESFGLDLNKPVVISHKVAKIKEKSRDINFNHGAKAFVPKTTPRSPMREINAEIKTWDLTLYGTSVRPAYDIKKENVQPNLAPPYPEEKYNFPDLPPMGHNDIDYDRETENRKDTQELKSTSGCLKWKGNVCLECTSDSTLPDGKCLSHCPDGFYDSMNDRNKNVEEISSPNASTCVRCHYSCKRCTGSMDYQCTECFPDALIYRSENQESYCYPTRVVIDVLSEKWYYTMIVMICIIFVVFLAIIVAYLCYKKHQRHNYAPLAISEMEEIRKIERKVKSTVYTDSE